MILETPLDEAWAALSHLPPARGTVAGYTGTARLEEVDDDTHTAILRLQGTGPNGPVTATITATLEAVGDQHPPALLHHARTRSPTRSVDPRPRPPRSPPRSRSPGAAAAADLGEAAVKPAPFEYVAVALDRGGRRGAQRDGAQVLAGGQSLVPLLNQRERAARAARRHQPDRRASASCAARTARLHIGATVRQAALERSPLVARHWPLLAQAVRHVGHPATRAAARSAARSPTPTPTRELPLALLALDARYVTSPAHAHDASRPASPASS